MGGGDLNMKKSWHPLTMQNQERKWKAEQAHEAEKKKLEELRQQLADEREREEMETMAIDAGLKKRSDRLEWMYRGVQNINRDEYLLGKKIDKQVDSLQQAADSEKEALSNGPGALFVPSDADVSVDLAAKIREDPLFAIRKREEERKKALMNNPVKLSQLKKALELTSDKKKKKSKLPLAKDLSRPFKHVDQSKSLQRHTHRDRSKSPPRHMHRDRPRSPQRHSHRDRSKSPQRHTHRDRPRSPQRHTHRDRPRSPRRHAHRDRSRSPQRHTHKDQPRSPQKHAPRTVAHVKVKSKMHESDMERRRQEMLSNAEWRESEREARLKRALQEEEEEMNDRNDRNPDFLQEMRVKSYSSQTTCSVADRIHRNKAMVQRTNAALDKNFFEK